MEPESQVGVPSKYNSKIAAEICAIVATCTDSLTVILARDERFPAKANWYMWLQKKPALRYKYARAKELQLTVMADEMMEITDTPKLGVTIITKTNGTTEEREGDMIQHRHLQIETRKWLLSKLAAKKYGDRMAPDGGVDKLNEIVKAMKAGPVPRGETNVDD